MSDFVLALTTVPREFDATQLSQELVATGLAACVSIIGGIRSVYTWEGVPQVDEEQQLIIKTTGAQVDALWDLLRERHPHVVPEFLVIPVVDGSEDYLNWVERSVGPRTES
jgi:periplasmic divalent cation tolerance protein